MGTYDLKADRVLVGNFLLLLHTKKKKALKISEDGMGSIAAA